MLKFIGLAILMASPCSLSQQDSTVYKVISYQKTRCFGSCPAFKFELYSNMEATYNGEAYVQNIGKWNAKLSKEEYQHIINEFEKSDFFEFAERYYEEISDRPTIYVTYSDGDREKKVMDYYGAPEELKKLEVKIDELIERLEWKKETNNQ